MKPDELARDKATIQYSEAPTYGGCDNLSQSQLEVVVSNDYPRASQVASRFDEQQSCNDLGQ